MRQRWIIAFRLVDVFGARLAVQRIDGQVVGDITRVADDVGFAAVRVERAVFLVGRGIDGAADGARGVVIRTELGIGLRQVADRGEFDAVIVADVPVQFGVVALGGGLVIAPAVFFVGQCGTATEHAIAFGTGLFQGHETEQSILDQRTTDIRGDLFLLEFIVFAAGTQRAVGCREDAGIGVVEVTRLGAQRLRCDRYHAAGFPGVGTGFGGDVDNATDRTAEFNTVATGQDLRLRDGAEWQFHCAQLCQWIGNRETVDVVRVFRRAATAEAGAGWVSRVAARGIWRQLNDGINVACNRQFVQLAGGEGRAVGGTGNIDAVAAARHLHGLYACGGASRWEGGFHALACQNFQRGRANNCLALHQGDGVVTDWQAGHAEGAIGVDRTGARSIGIGVFQHNAIASASIDLAENGTCGI